MAISTKSNDQAPQSVNFKIDPVVKEAADSVLSGMGLNISAYVGMCLRQVAQDRKVPFKPTTNPGFWLGEEEVSKAIKILKNEYLEDFWYFHLKSTNRLNTTFSAYLDNYIATLRNEMLDHASNLYGDECPHLKLQFSYDNFAEKLEDQLNDIEELAESLTADPFEALCELDTTLDSFAEAKELPPGYEALSEFYEELTETFKEKLSKNIDFINSHKDLIEEIRSSLTPIEKEELRKLREQVEESPSKYFTVEEIMSIPTICSIEHMFCTVAYTEESLEEQFTIRISSTDLKNRMDMVRNIKNTKKRARKLAKDSLKQCKSKIVKARQRAEKMGEE